MRTIPIAQTDHLSLFPNALISFAPTTSIWSGLSVALALSLLASSTLSAVRDRQRLLRVQSLSCCRFKSLAEYLFQASLSTLPNVRTGRSCSQLKHVVYGLPATAVFILITVYVAHYQDRVQLSQQQVRISTSGSERTGERRGSYTVGFC